MKEKLGNTMLIGLLLVLIPVLCFAEEASSLEKWQKVEQTAEIIAFFDNLFGSMGVHINETGEQITVAHMGDWIDLYEGIDETAVDFVIYIDAFQVDRLARFALAGDIAEEEQYRVMKELFTPATASLLGRPEVSRPIVKRISRAEDLIHVRLRSIVAGEEDVSHTLIYANRQWLVFPGLHGEPERFFDLSLSDAIVFQKTIFATMESDKAGRWAKFGRWYRRWRRDSSIVY